METCKLLLLLACVLQSSQARRVCCEKPDPSDRTLTTLESDQFDQCICLHDNVITPEETLVAGEYKYFHWRMEDFGLTMHNDSSRPEIKFHFSPCSGQGNMYVSPLITPWPTSESYRWNATNTGEDSVLRVQAFHADYFVSIEAVTNLTFSLSVFTDDATFPELPDSHLEVLQVGKNTLNVTFNTSSVEDGRYLVYYTKRVGDCAENEEANFKCLMRTGCGMRLVGTSAMNQFQQFPSNSQVSVPVVNLDLDVEYSINVAMRTPDGVVVPYNGVLGTPTYNKVTEAMSPDVTMIAGVSMLGVAVVLLSAVFVMKRNWDKKKIYNTRKKK